LSGLGRAISSISGRAQNHSPNRSSVQGFSLYHSPKQQLESSAEKAVSYHEKKICGPPFFPRGVSPVEAVLGDSCILARRMERSTVFPEWKSSVRLFMKISGSRIAYPDFGSRLVLPLPGLMKNILRLFRFRRACEGWITSLLIPSQSRVLCRGEQLLLTFFWRGVSPVETELGESCELGRRISRSAVFDDV